MSHFWPGWQRASRRDRTHVLGVVDLAYHEHEQALEVVRRLDHLCAEFGHRLFGRTAFDDDRHRERALFKVVLLFDHCKELVGFFPVVDIPDLRNDESVNMLDCSLFGIGDLQHVLEAIVPGFGAVTVSDDTGVNLAGELRAVFRDNLGDVLCTLLTHVRRCCVLVVRHQTSGACIPESPIALRSFFAESSSPCSSVGVVKNGRTNLRSCSCLSVFMPFILKSNSEVYLSVSEDVKNGITPVPARQHETTKQ